MQDEKKVNIVLDLGFGDSGKGITVDWLCSQTLDTERTLVVRFAGGHQVGHTVVMGNNKHTFSNLGSGTFRGITTFYGPDTTVFLPGLILETNKLKDWNPKVILSPQVQLTSPLDIAWNQYWESFNKHGSCGVGYGATVERVKHGISFTSLDLSFKWVAKQKLLGIRTYYLERLQEKQGSHGALVEELKNFDLDTFLDICYKAADLYKICSFKDLVSSYDYYIFEGNQGIPLDRYHGMYPHVSWSNTCSSTARELLEILGKEKKLVNLTINYVSRTYQTRHGNGPMPNSISISLKNTESEANHSNKWQGEFRICELDPDLLRWSLETDKTLHSDLIKDIHLSQFNTNLIITCLDQRPEFSIDGLLKKLGYTFNEVWASFSPDSKDFKRYR